MSQQYRRITFADFMRDAARVFDGIEARGETVLVERGGKVFVVTAWQATRRRTPAKRQPPNMQDSLWSVAGLGASTQITSEDGAEQVDPEGTSGVDARRGSRDRSPSSAADS